MPVTTFLRTPPRQILPLGRFTERLAQLRCRYLRPSLVAPRLAFCHHFSVFSPLRADKDRNQLAQSPRSLSTLRENIYTIPNLLTVSRIVACPVLGWAIVHDNFEFATALLVYAGLTDTVCSSPLLSRLLMSRILSQGGRLHRSQVQDEFCIRNHLGSCRG